MNRRDFITSAAAVAVTAAVAPATLLPKPVFEFPPDPNKNGDDFQAVFPAGRYILACDFGGMETSMCYMMLIHNGTSHVIRSYPLHELDNARRETQNEKVQKETRK